MMTLKKQPPDVIETSGIDVVFVHGLEGSPTRTWQDSKNNIEFWPNWLLEELRSIQIWTLAWPAKTISWVNPPEMTMQDRALSVLELLDNNRIGTRRLVFICHSMGGLLVKQLLRSSADLDVNHRLNKISASTVGVVFMGTPHTGSALANVANIALGSSVKLQELKRNDGILRDLNNWYKAYVSKSTTKTLVFYETQPVAGLLIVDQSSADPGVPNCVAVPVDADHFGICKPSSQYDPIYQAIFSFLETLGSEPEGTVALKTSGKIDAFRTHYLFSETGSLPFGGREDEIKVLNEWLADEAAPRRLLITGPTGRGKSTLLVHWAEALIHMPAEDPWQIVFLPISIRFGTNRPSVFYHLLASQLADSLNHPLQTPVMDPEGFYTGVATSMLQELAARMTKVLIVVDGVDEALDQRFDATIFPIQLPITLKIVVSARELANDAGAEGWKKRLGWDANVRVKSLEVSILDKRGVVAVLQSVGLYPGKIHDEVINRILELTEGEPLLLKLYAEDLLLIAHQQEQINISDLVGLKPGFGAYVSRWFEHQRQAWKEEGNTIDLATDGTLAVLACALGPLQTDHLVPLVCKITGVAAPLSVEHFIRPVRRFVTGSGTLESGYILNHPMLGQYLCEEYFDDSIVSRVHEEFANWGRINVELLKKGNFQNAVPPYLLQYYV